MARALPKRNKTPKPYVAKDDRGFPFDDILKALSTYDNNLDIINGDLEWGNEDDAAEVVTYTNDEGLKFVFKERELNDVLESAVQKVINDKNIDLYSEVEKALKEFVKDNIKELEKRCKKFFNDKLDAVAEKIAIESLNYNIEEKVREKLADKLSKIQTIINEKS